MIPLNLYTQFNLSTLQLLRQIIANFDFACGDGFGQPAKNICKLRIQGFYLHPYLKLLRLFLGFPKTCHRINHKPSFLCCLIVNKIAKPIKTNNPSDAPASTLLPISTDLGANLNSILCFPAGTDNPRKM